MSKVSMKLYYCLFCMLITSALFGQQTIDTTCVLIYDSISRSTTDLSVYLNPLNGSTDTLPNFKFDTITESDFTRYKILYQPEIDKDSKKAEWTDTSFIIKAGNAKLVSPANKNDYSHYVYYVGYLAPLQLYIVSDIDGHNEVGTLVLIDAKTGKQFYMESPYDEPCETVLLSPKKHYLLTYANTWYEHDQGYISIFKIKRDRKHYRLSCVKSSYLAFCNIKNIVWITDTEFAISVTAKKNPEDNNADMELMYYLKASFE